VRGTWDDVNRRVTSTLLALDLDDVLVVGERVEPVRRGLLGGLLGGGGTTTRPRRWVQVTAGRDRLTAECVGSTSFGGEWEMDEALEAELLSLGWERPWSERWPTFSREAPLVNAPRLSRACVRALQVLGCEVADLEAELRHEDPEE